MRRTVCILALAAVSLLSFHGCMFFLTDHPVPVDAIPPISLDDRCADELDMGSRWIDYSSGDWGPASMMEDWEIGEMWWAVDSFEALDGSLWARIDTYRNPIGGLNVVGCPPGFFCHWEGPLDGHGACEPKLDQLDADGFLCNVGNGACDEAGLPWWGPPADPDPGPNFDYTRIWLVALDMTPGLPMEGIRNVRRTTMNYCVECDIKIPALHQMMICHYPPGNPEAAHAQVIAKSSWDAHQTHGDNEGPCLFPGGPKNRRGLRVPPHNRDAPEPAGYYAATEDLSFHRIPSGLPHVDDYGAGRAMTEEVAGMLRDVRLGHEADEIGFAQLALRAIHAGTATLELDPPVRAAIDLEWTERGLAWKFMTDSYQEGLVEILRFFIENTRDGEPVDLARFRFALDGGLVIDGSTIQAAVPFVLTLNHSGVEKRVERLVAHQGLAPSDPR